MQRRNFLKSMVVLAAVAATPAIASTVVEAAKPNKYKEALRLFDLAVACASDDRVNQRLDNLLVYLRENFAAPEYNEANLDAMAKLLGTKVDIAGIRGIPPNVADEIYPVALMKMGLTSYQMAANPNKMTEFDWFHETYGNLIINSSDVTRQRRVNKTA